MVHNRNRLSARGRALPARVLTDGQILSLHGVGEAGLSNLALHRHTAKYRQFVASMQDELPGWRPDTWSEADEAATFPECKNA